MERGRLLRGLFTGFMDKFSLVVENGPDFECEPARGVS